MSASYSGFSVLPGRKVICPGKLRSLIDTHVYLVGQKTLLNRDPCRALGSWQLLVIGSWLSYNSANTELITIKSGEMPVPSKLGLASTICAWWRHLHQWLCLPVCLVRTNVPFNYCISLCYVSYFFMFPLIPFPPSSSVHMSTVSLNQNLAWFHLHMCLVAECLSWNLLQRILGNLLPLF